MPRTNGEDFALTPYVFTVYVTSLFEQNKGKIFGIGLCWGFWSIFIGIGIDIPKSYPFFISYNK